ncbi:MAG: TonB-dependent receptor [Succiniclasticum sp.]|jgi:iron complex outermembrane receptor protein|nr:TonB-dependent receptor [Succiniclasticum sp.]
MVKRISAATVAAVVAVLLGGIHSVASAGFDENLNAYTLDTVVVEGSQAKNKFGDTVTEQSYYRTGGDVKVITREEIEKRHYHDVTDAIKRVPGVTFTNAGYRGGEYGYNSYNNSMAINGDSRVIVLVDGRRVDNSTSTRFGDRAAAAGRTMVDLNQLVSMADVEKIEVIKGPGASVYGADATGGVINIITRKGGDKNEGTVEVSTGSWKKHIYNLTYSGSAGADKSWKYFVSASRNMAGDSRYHDGLTGEDHTYTGTSYKEDGVSVRLDKEFTDKQNLRVWYNHKDGHDGYPITARDWRYWSESDWNRIIERTTRPGGYGNTDNPGYRNLFSLDALSGSYNAYRNNDLDITYTFDKDNGMESFVRYYNQKHHYWGVDRYPDWVLPDGSYVPFPDSAQWESFIRNYNFPRGLDPTTVYDEENHGVQLQYGKSVGIHDLLTSVTYDKAKTSRVRLNRATQKYETTKVDRKTVYGYLQDKIHLTDRWDFTPAVRFSHYSDYVGGAYSDVGGGTTYTPTLNTQYAFSDSLSAYLGWTKVYRPLKARDYSIKTPNGDSLRDEEGNVYTIGIRKDIGDKTNVSVHYDWTDMSNAVTYYSVWDSSAADFANKAVNAREKKKSFNITMDHQFDDHWNLSLAYTYLHDKWQAKDGMQFDPDISLNSNSNVNTMINQLRPANHYTANVSYENGKWYTGLLANWYTGASKEAFTHSRALVLDWNVNYDFRKDMSAYLTITNLTNQAYENAYSAYNGLGAAPQPGRAIMIGMKYKF